MSEPLTDAWTPAEMAEKRRYVESRAARDHWGAAELDCVDQMARWLNTIDAAVDGHRLDDETIDHLRADRDRYRAVVDAAKKLRRVTPNPPEKPFDPAAAGWYTIRRELTDLDEALASLTEEDRP